MKQKKEHWKQLISLILVIVMLQVLFANLKKKFQSSASSENTLFTLNVPKRITSVPHVVAAAHKHNLSSNALNDVVTGLTEDCRADVNDFIISASTTRKARRTARSNEFELTKNKFYPI